MINKIFGKLGYVKKEQLEMLNTLIRKKEEEIEEEKRNNKKLSMMLDTKTSQINMLNECIGKQQNKIYEIDKKCISFGEEYEKCRCDMTRIDNQLKRTEEKNRELIAKMGGTKKEINKIKANYLFALKLLTGISKKDEANITYFKVELKKLEKWSDERLKLK